MSKREPKVEWHVAKDDTDWAHLCTQPTQGMAQGVAPVAQDRSFAQQFFWEAAALLLLLAGVGGWAWRTDQGRTQQAAAQATMAAQPALDTIALVALPQSVGESTVSAQREMQAFAPKADSAADSLTGDPATTDAWRQLAVAESTLRAANLTHEAEDQLLVERHIVTQQGDQLVIKLIMHTKDRAQAYRQTRFYRHTAEGWQQTYPDAALWGPERSLATPSFVFHFRQNDAAVVIAVAAQVDALYRILRGNFGLPLAPTPEKLVIEVSVTQNPGSTHFVGEDRLVVASPALYLAPVELTDAELLEQSIALPLLTYLLVQASEYHALESTWQPLLSGLRLWQVWDLDLPLSVWQKEVVQWTYVDSSTVYPEQPVVLPERYEALCTAHTLWMPSPMQLGIPLLCTELDWKNWYFALWGSRGPLLRLDQFTMPAPRSLVEGSVPVSHPGQTVALATLIDYAVATYGRERLPVLVPGLGQYDSWETLILVVYGVSAAEFEAGWQAYLSAHYGVSLDSRTQ